MTWFRRILPRWAAPPARTDDDYLGLLLVTHIETEAATAAEKRQGVVVWARVELYAAIIVCVAIRRRADGRHVIAFPKRRDPDGDELEIVSSPSEVGRAALTDMLLKYYGLDGEVTP